MPPKGLAPGTLIADRYEVEQEVGRGHHGAVYQAVDRRLETRIALKVAEGGGAAAFEGFKARFRREAMIGYRLGRQTGFVSAFDWGHVDASTLYLAMDLIAGARSLELRRGERPRRLDALLEAGRLVAETHARGVIHRDLKPSNFLVDRGGQVYIADFGLAKLVGERPEDVADTTALTQTNTALGTCVFMSPEQFEDAKHADARSDVFSLGVMLFLALTRKLPYPGKSGAAVFKQLMRVRHGRAEPADPRQHDPATIPVNLSRACTRALAIDPAKRTPSAEAFVQDLERALGRIGEARSPGRIPVTTNDPREAIPAATSKGPGTLKAIKAPRPVKSTMLPKPQQPPGASKTMTPWQRFKQEDDAP